MTLDQPKDLRLTTNRMDYSLTYSVPDLELDDFVVYLEAIRAKLYSNCDLMLFLKLIVHDSLHQTTFSNSSVSNDDKFEKVVLSWDCLV